MYFFDSVFETDRENNPEVSGYTQKRSDESEENSNAESASDFELESWIELYAHEELVESTEGSNENPEIEFCIKPRESWMHGTVYSTYENSDGLEEHNCDNSAVSLDREYKSLANFSSVYCGTSFSIKAAENCD